MRETPTPARRGGLSIGTGLLALAVVVGALGAFAVARWSGWSPFATETVDRSAPVVLEQLRDLARYKAASGEFSQIIDVEQDVSRLPGFLAGERTLLLAVGTVDAEVDFSRLAGEYVQVSRDGKRAEIHLPPAELSEPRLDVARTHVVDRDRGIVNRVSEALSGNPGDDRDLYVRAAAALGDAAAATELRARAEENTRVMLTSLLQGLGFTEVVVVFDAPVP